MQGASLSLADTPGLRTFPGHNSGLPPLPRWTADGDGDYFAEGVDAYEDIVRAPSLTLPVYNPLPPLPPLSVPVVPDVAASAPSPPPPPTTTVDENGQVVLDTTAMVYDRRFAYYDVLATKQSNERRLFSRASAARQPKGTGAKGLSGDKKVEYLRELLEHGFTDDRNRPIVRSKEQRELHETYIKVTLPLSVPGHVD